jgi:hypothetical protein
MKPLRQIRSNLLETAEVISPIEEGIDPEKKKKNLEISMDYLRKKIRDEKNFYKNDEYREDLRRLQAEYDELDDIEEANQAPVAEDLNAEKDPVDKWIADYAKSTDARFQGKSKSDRIKMALSDYHAAQKASGKEIKESHIDGTGKSEDISMTRLELDEIADMADDLFNVLPNFDDCPAWVQHKVAAMHAGLNSIYDYRLKGIERDQACTNGIVTVSIATPQNPVVQPSPIEPAPMD